MRDSKAVTEQTIPAGIITKSPIIFLPAVFILTYFILLHCQVQVIKLDLKQIAPYKKGKAYSVLPLAWPHAEFIRTWNLYKKRFL